MNDAAWWARFPSRPCAFVSRRWRRRAPPPFPRDPSAISLDDAARHRDQVPQGLPADRRRR
jgi:hypothetical protein